MSPKLDRNDAVQAFEPSRRSEAADDVVASRRALAGVLGVLGAAALAGCANGSAQEDMEALDIVSEALAGNGTLKVADTAANLRTITGGATSWVAVLQGVSAAADGGGGIFYWSTTAKADDGWSVLNSGAGNSAGWRRVNPGFTHVNSIVALRALPGGSTRSIAILTGYTTAGDGGGGVFVWSTTAAPDDGGTVFNASAGNTAGWRRVFSGALNVRWFGATGGGTTPDQAAFQQTINVAASSGKGTVFVPNGVYRIQATVDIPSDVNVHGEGERSLIFWVGSASLAYDAFRIKGHRNTIRELCFKGENGGEDGTGFDKGASPGLSHQQRAIDMDLATFPHHDIAVTHCWFKNLFGFSIHNQDTYSERFRFTHKVCKYTSNGINVSGRDVDISHNTILEAEGIETASDHCIVSGNTLRGFMAGISCGGRTTPPASRNNTIIGNTIDMTNESGERSAIVVPGSTDVTISGNTILNCPGVAIIAIAEPTFPSGYNFSKRLTITGNSIVNERTSGPTQARGIFLASVEDVVIDGNVIKGVDTYPVGYYVDFGILLTYCTDVTIGSNVLRLGRGGIHVSDCSNVIMSGNRVHDFFVGIDMVNSAGVNVLGNIVAACDLDVRTQAGCSEVRLVANKWGSSSFASGVAYSAGNSP